MVVVKQSKKHGRGVFARCDFRKGDVIEVAPLIVCPNSDLSWLSYNSNNLSRYIYQWGEYAFAVACGAASFLNHSYRPNARYKLTDDKKHGPLITIKAYRKIKAGDEILINYNYKPWSKAKVHFGEALEPAPGALRDQDQDAEE